MNIGPTELIVILVIALIVFGPRKLPDLGKSLGQAMAQFRRASDDFKRSWEQEVELEKTRINDIKGEIEAPSAADDYQTSESYDYTGGESEPAGVEQPADLTSEPAPATVGTPTEAPRSEHWI